MKENIIIPAGTASIDIETLVKINAGPVVPPPVNKPPVVAIDVPATIVLPDTLTLKATATDLDGSIKSYLWSKKSGGAATITDIAKAQTNVTGLVAGPYVFQLVVKDDKDASTLITANVDVKPAIVIPPPSAIKYLQLPKGQARTLNNVTGQTIEKQLFNNQDAGFQNGNILWLNNCHDITFVNCAFGNSKGVAIYAYQCSNIRVIDSLNFYTKGFFNASRCTGGIHIKNSQMINGYGSGAPYEGKDGNLYKLTECKGPGYGVENCRVHNFPGESNPEDIVSLFASEGVAGSPILIKGNLIVGGGPSQSGGGVVAGDGTNTFTGGWVDILDNALLNPGQYGAACAGGHDINIIGNKIYSDRFAWSNNPLFVWNQYAPVCTKITIKNNWVNWTDRNGAKNNGWNAGNCSATTFEIPKPITLAEMKSVIPDHLITFLTPAELLQVRAAK